MLAGYTLKRWLMLEVHGIDIGKRPPQKESFLHPNKPARNALYRAWIRSLPCVACGSMLNVEAAHTGPHGLTQKASDYTCIPLCHAHHRTGNDALDKIGREAFQRYFSLRIDDLVQELNWQWSECEFSMKNW